jgi:uncharacterized protein (DUF433 family)
MARIVSVPKVMLGKPVIEGTRLTVEMIREELGAGTSTEDLLDTHLNLTREGIQDAIAYAAAVIGNNEVCPLGEITG